MSANLPPSEAFPITTAAPKQSTFDAAVMQIAQEMRLNVPRTRIVEGLVQRMNMSQFDAERLVSQVYDLRKRARKNAGLRDMLIGAVICIIGTVITVATLSAARSGGGTYVVAYGAILFGAFQFLRGLFNWIR